jgi:hypothetical protein
LPTAGGADLKKLMVILHLGSQIIVIICQWRRLWSKGVKKAILLTGHTIVGNKCHMNDFLDFLAIIPRGEEKRDSD